MRHLQGVGTDRGYSMIGLGIGLGLGEVRLPTVGFNPAKISGLKAWWDATDASTLYQSTGGSLASADGDPLGEWQDKSGNLLHWTQASGTNKPALKKTIKNSKDVIRFDGTNDVMSIAGSNSSLKLLHGQLNTVFMVFNISSLAGDRCFFDSAGGTTNNTGRYLAVTTAGVLTSQGYNSSGSQATSAFINNSSASYIAINTWYVISYVSDPGNATVANRSYVYKNGGNLSQNNTANGTPSSSNSTNDLFLGAISPNVNRFVGDFGEIIIYDSALSAGDRALVEGYLNNKWGVY